MSERIAPRKLNVPRTSTSEAGKTTTSAAVPTIKKTTTSPAVKKTSEKAATKKVVEETATSDEKKHAPSLEVCHLNSFILVAIVLQDIYAVEDALASVLNWDEHDKEYANLRQTLCEQSQRLADCKDVCFQFLIL